MIEKMDVVLIYLPKPFLKEPEAQAPLGLMYLAAVLEGDKRSVELANYSSHTEDEAIAELTEAVLYGITVTSMEIPYANSFAKRIKEKYPKSRIILGGPGIYSREVFDWIDKDVIDSVCMGEGERIITKILDDAKRGCLKCWYTGIPTEYLDGVPFPARHLLKNKQGGNIFAHGYNYIGNESTVILSSRGCPWNCSFCSAPALRDEHGNGRMRFRGNHSIISEMKHVIDEYGIRQFRFSDDSFTSGKARMISLCKEIEKLNVAWRISCRVKPLDEEMLQALWNAGCKELSFGIESFDTNVLKGLQKGTTCEDNVSALELADKVGFQTRMLFMIRTPFQTKETIRLNRYWIQRVPFSVIACTSFIPIPGSDVWENPDKYNIEILSKDLLKYNFYMFGPEGRRKLEPLIKIKDRDLTEFMEESEEFRAWVDEFTRREV
ncbi:MAG TPA: hypothetical protein DSN98_08315 [Thermoplasmata archaeon]|nr:MAG TPA: hypothetical protein DSN98_08315 [Thermoplasmata archaeon]